MATLHEIDIRSRGASAPDGADGWVTRLFRRDATTPEIQDLKFDLHRKLLTRVNLDALMRLPEALMRSEMQSAVARLVEEAPLPLSRPERDRIAEDVLDEVFGLGPLEPLLQDDTISDILVTTPKMVHIERAGKLHRTPVEFKDNAHLIRIIERIVSKVGRRIDESSPMVDARLPDGSRVNAVIPPISIDGPILSIRRFGKRPLSPQQLVKNLSLTEDMLRFLEACVAARLNIIVCGGTGAGKTTLLNAMSTFIPETERIVTIEDSAELQLQQEHVARLETRPPNVENQGAVKIRQLVINALRMRPDRIIVGEVRADEALDMMQAMNTGHDGSLTTIHANSPRDGISRIEVMMGMANSNMSAQSIRQQIASAVNVFVQVMRCSDGTRKVSHITECVGMERDIVTTQDIFVFEKSGIGPDGRVLGRFRAGGIRPKCSEKLQTAGFDLPPQTYQKVVELR